MKHRWSSILLALIFLLSCGSCAPREEPSGSLPEEGLLTVTYFDVGQADAILISLPDGRFVQIDGGNDGDGKTLEPQLRALGVETLDFVVGTHPHADHIGGLDELIDAFSVGKVYLPRTSASDTPTTRTYENLLEAVQNKGLKLTQAKADAVLIDEPGLRLVCLAPASADYGDLNDYSVVLRLTYGSRSFLFTGDAGEESEREMLMNGAALRADVLKVGHHGSDTASTEDFLRAVRPDWAVISCGRDNSYGHPHAETVQRLREAGAQLLRTDEEGTVTVHSDGDFLQIETQAGTRQTESGAEPSGGAGAAESAAESEPAESRPQEDLTVVYRTPSGSRYHRADCSALGDRSQEITLADAREAGLLPCQRCHPPE